MTNEINSRPYDHLPLEKQMGNALFLALKMLRTGEWDNAAMARVERVFKAWCDKEVDSRALEQLND